MKAVLNEIGFYRSELEAIRDCFVCGIIDGADDDGREFVMLSFYNPTTKKYVQLVFDEDGNAFITEPSSEEE